MSRVPSIVPSPACAAVRQPRRARTADPRLTVAPAVCDGLLLLAVLGAALVLLVPAARAHWAWLGWGPLWLVGMPLAAWWVAAGLPRPAWPPRARRRGPQARRVVMLRPRSGPAWHRRTPAAGATRC
jgi:hypothetical protein